MYEYLNPDQLKHLLNGKSISPALFAIGSVGDLLLLTEYNKETLPEAQYQTIYSQICSDNEKYHIQEVGKDELLNNLFEENTEELTLNSYVERFDTPPHFTINYIGLRPNEAGNFWNSNVVEEMCEYYGY